MDRQVFQQLLHRSPASHKYDFGHVMVVGGSPGMVGAPFLSARAALRVGAGLVTVASAPEVIDKLEKRAEEIMSLRLSDDLGELLPYIKDRKISVVAVGSGMQPELAGRVIKVLQDIDDIRVIIDGGGLAALQNDPRLIRPNFILTPHVGEFQRFFTEPLPANREDLQKTAAGFARQHQILLVLKGNPTYICAPAGQVSANEAGGPELATAGTGDVLTGVIAGIIAQKIEPLAAAKAAAYLHGLAGKLAAAAKTEPGVIAGDVIESIPAALKLVLEKEL